MEDQVDLLVQAAGDDHGRVRLEAIVAASWLSQNDGLSILNESANYTIDDWMRPSYETARARLLGETVQNETPEEIETSLTGNDRDLFMVLW